MVAQIPENIKSLIETYVGLLISDKELTTQPKIKHTMLPIEMQDERNILRAIEVLSSAGHPITKHGVEAVLTVNNWAISKPVSSIADAVGSAWRNDIEGSIRLCNDVIHQWYFETDGMNSWLRAADIMADLTLGAYSDRYEQARKLIAHVSPNVESLKIISDKVLVDETMAEYAKKRKLLLEEGKFPNPVPHLASLRELGISFSDGEFSLLLGHEGTGKSSFAQQLAEHIAWHQGLGYDVLYLSLETAKEILGYRTLSRNCGVPFNDFMFFKVDEKSKEYLTVYNDFLEKRLLAEETSGYVQYAMLNDKSVEGIIDAIHQAYMITTSAKRKLFIILDHIGRVDKPRIQGSNDANIITDSVIRIANACNGIQSHIMFIGHSDNSGDGKLFGATQVNKNSQLVMVLESEMPKGGVMTDEPAFDYLGRKMADYLGRPRYNQRVGNTHGSRIKVRIVKGNNIGGGSVDVLVERPMSSLFSDDREQLEEIKRRNSST